MHETKIEKLISKFIENPILPEYISPSQVNQFLSNKMGFIGRILGFDRTDNINFQKGNTVERAVSLFFDGVAHGKENAIPNPEKAIGDPLLATELSINLFKFEASNMTKYEETLAYLPKLCLRAIEHYNGIGEKPVCQVKIDGEIDGRRILGITDFDFGVIRDCKVTGKTPSEMPQSHKNAAYMYSAITGKDVVYDYFIPLKSEMRVVSFDFEKDDITEKLVRKSLSVIDGIYQMLKQDPKTILYFADYCLSDPTAGYGDCPEIEYYLS